MRVKTQPEMSILVSSIQDRKKGYMDRKVSVFLDKDAKIDLDSDAFAVVNTLPDIKDAKTNIFYILPDNTLNYVSNNEWKSISGGGPDPSTEYATKEYVDSLVGDIASALDTINNGGN